MKYIKLFIFIVLVLNQLFFHVSVNAQAKKTIPIAIATAAVAGIIHASNLESVKGALERQMVEWILQNRKFEGRKFFDLRMLLWNAAKREDLSNVSIAVFSYSEFGKLPIVYLNILSPGWINDFGVDFSKVKIVEIDQAKWSSIIIKYLNLARKQNMPEITDIEFIPAFDRKDKMYAMPFYLLIGLSMSGVDFMTELEAAKFYFDDGLNPDSHVIEDLDENFIIDYHGGDLNLYVKNTSDLVRFKRNAIVEITRLLFVNKITVTAY
jgi:hypothetical protein